MSEEYTSGSYRMELLKAGNWLPWKRRMLAVLRDLGLEKYVMEDASKSVDDQTLTEEEKAVQKSWKIGDAKART